MLEQLPEIRDSIMRENEGKWLAIAKHQMKNYFNPDQAEIQRHAQRYNVSYIYAKTCSGISCFDKDKTCFKPFLFWENI